jgi:hypothetical protein
MGLLPFFPSAFKVGHRNVPAFEVIALAATSGALQLEKAGFVSHTGKRLRPLSPECWVNSDHEDLESSASLNLPPS